jgi:hypothetical protein
VFITLDPDFTIEGARPTEPPTDLALVVGQDVTDTDWDETTGTARRYTLDVELKFEAGSNAAIACIEVGEGESVFLSMNTKAGTEDRAIVAPVLRSHWGNEAGNPCPAPRPAEGSEEDGPD